MFAVYTAIVCKKDPDRLTDLLAYMVTMINEAMRFKYKGWLTYDEMFRQSVAKSKSTCWSELNSTLYVITFLSQQQGDCHFPSLLIFRSSHIPVCTL